MPPLDNARCLSKTVHEPTAVNIVFFTEVSLGSEDNRRMLRDSSFRLPGELSRYAPITVSVPGKRSWIDDLQAEYPDMRIVHRKLYGGSMIGFFVRLPLLLIPTWRSIRKLVGEADIVVSRVPSPILGLVNRAARRCGRPHVLYIIADIEEAARNREKYPPPIRAALARWAARWIRNHQKRIARSQLVAAIGDALAAQYCSVARRCELLFASAVRRDEIVARLDTCQSDTVELLHVARLVPLKGTRFLIDALRIVRDAGQRAHLTIIGTGPLREQLTGYCRAMGLQQHVTFAGPVAYGEQLFAFYRRADVFVHPSLSESFPRVLWEAMAAGLPIVATDVGGVATVLQSRTVGLVAAPGSGEALARAIMRVIEDKALRRKLIRGGHELVQEHTVEAQARHLWRLLCDEVNRVSRQVTRAENRSGPWRGGGGHGA
jgi:glycosyltransferase involved in cell wall biosynthesis